MSTITGKKSIDYQDVERYYRIKEDALIKSKKKKQKSSGNLIQFNYFLFAAILFILSLGIIFNYAAITQSKMEINNLNKEIELLVKQKEDILISLESIKNSNIIEKNAMNYLGMDYANSSQNNFIAVKYSDAVDGEFAYDSFYKDSASLDRIIEKTFLLFADEGI